MLATSQGEVCPPAAARVLSKTRLGGTHRPYKLRLPDGQRLCSWWDQAQDRGREQALLRGAAMGHGLCGPERGRGAQPGCRCQPPAVSLARHSRTKVTNPTLHALQDDVSHPQEARRRGSIIASRFPGAAAPLQRRGRSCLARLPGPGVVSRSASQRARWRPAPPTLRLRHAHPGTWAASAFCFLFLMSRTVLKNGDAGQEKRQAGLGP